ncbi:MAG: hypothetical protein AB2L24_12655 [Mangrovibacterium sp.]
MRQNIFGDRLLLMPQSYYTLSSSSQIIIPPGEVNTGIEVQLTDEFFNDPLALLFSYVTDIQSYKAAYWVCFPAYLFIFYYAVSGSKIRGKGSIS